MMIKVDGKVVVFEQFPNGETLFKNEFYLMDRVGSCIVEFKYENDSDLIKLMFVKKELDLNGISSSLKILYMPYSRMDRKQSVGTSFTLKYVSEFINSLEFNMVVIVEPHSDISEKLINNSVSWLVTKELLMEFLSEEIVPDYICFPDKGARSRYESEFEEFNLDIINCDKTRDFDTGKILDLKINSKIKQGSNIVICDDLSSYGGTFLWCAEKLKEKGAGDIYLIVGHAEESILEGKIPNSDLIKKVYTTNSIIDKKHETNKIKIRRVI